MAQSIQAHILWGVSPSTGDVSESYSFKSKAEMGAFIMGVNECVGWQDFCEVDVPGAIDQEGEFQPHEDADVKLAAEGFTPAAPFVARVIWGESPEPGTEPDCYWFATDEERISFISGISEALGNEGFEVVDGPGEVNEDGEFELT